MAESMGYGGSGPGDFIPGSWLDGIMNSLQNEIASDFVTPAALHHSRTDPASMNSMGVHEMAGSTSLFSDNWFDLSGEIESTGEFGRNAGGFEQGTSGGGDQFLFLGHMNRKPAAASFQQDVGPCLRPGSKRKVQSSAHYELTDVPGFGSPTVATDFSNHQYQQTMFPQPQVRQQFGNSVWNGKSQSPIQVHPAPLSAKQVLQRCKVEPEPEPEDSGVRLVHLLLGCAEHLSRDDLLSAEMTLKSINEVLEETPKQKSGPMSRVAAHFAEALTQRLYGICPNSQEVQLFGSAYNQDAVAEGLHYHFYETCPYLKFAHFTANQAILEAVKGAQHVHVIDFNLNWGLQWPALIQALALRPGGPPTIMITGIGPPSIGGDGRDPLNKIGRNLAKFAEELNVKFDFRGVIAKKLDDIKPWMFEVQPGEIVAVNAMMQLHKLLSSGGSSSDGIDDVFRTIRSLHPKIITISEQEAHHNSENFLDRFMEALHFYSSMFDSIEAGIINPETPDHTLAEIYLGREICNIVACEGSDRVERHESLNDWNYRLVNAGFRQIHMGSNAFKQANALLIVFAASQGYRVEDNEGCLTLCWHGRPLIAASAWHCS